MKKRKSILDSLPKPYTERQKCSCCKGKGSITKNSKGEPIPCAYCDGEGERDIVLPHPSHVLTKWRSEIRSPCGTARFYSVRNCSECGAEESQHPAGHFCGLAYPCKGKKK